MGKVEHMMQVTFNKPNEEERNMIEHLFKGKEFHIEWDEDLVVVLASGTTEDSEIAEGIINTNMTKKTSATVYLDNCLEDDSVREYIIEDLLDNYQEELMEYFLRNKNATKTD